MIRPTRRPAVREERGAVVVIVVILLVALFGMVALTVDVGGLLSRRRALIRGADSGALAAAQSCAAAPDAANAQTRAVQFLQTNVPDATLTSYDAEGCGTQSAGVVTVSASAEQDLPFAVVMGFPESTTVSATAHALWAPSRSASVIPIEFPLTPTGQFPCAQEEGETCAYWYDPENDHDIGNASNYGFLNISEDGVKEYPEGANEPCPAAGSSALEGWIRETREVALGTNDVTYVCFTGGHRSNVWYDALLDRADGQPYDQSAGPWSQTNRPGYSEDAESETFPINDPRCMVRTNGREKACVVGFFTAYITEVIRGDDPRAVGVPAQSGRCQGQHRFGGLDSTLNLDTWGECRYPAAVAADGGPDSVNGLELRIQGRGGGVLVQGRDYVLEGHTIRWLRTDSPNVRIEFEWTWGGTPGLCGQHDRDPNGVCVQVLYAGARFVQGDPDPSLPDFGTRGIRLCDPLGEPPGSPCDTP